MITTQPSNKNRPFSRNRNGARHISNSFEILVQATQMVLTSELQEAITRKIGRVRQYAPEAFRARVNLDRELKKSASQQFRVRVRYELPGQDLLAEHRSFQLLTALDLVAEKIERRLRKRKTAELASRFGRRGKSCRIAELCG